jgi:hypothetical protein
MGGAVGFTWKRERRRVGLALYGIMVVMAIVATIAAQPGALSEVIDPVSDLNNAIAQARQLASGSERGRIEARGRDAIRAAFPIDSETLDALRGHTVHVAPYQAAVAWAYGLKWMPLPVFQSYQAYTTNLDRLNANALDASGAPERILRKLEPGIDGRVQTLDEPLAMRAMLCRYRQIRVTATWQVLARGANQCSEPPTALGRVRAGWGQQVAVPAPPDRHSFVFVRISGVAVQGLERVLALLYKPSERTIALDGVTHRLVGETAGDGLVLRAPADIDYTAPYNIAPNASTIAVGKAGQGRAGTKALTFSFYAQHVD